MKGAPMRKGMPPVLQAVCCRYVRKYHVFAGMEPAAITGSTPAITNVKSL
jgi:hypothetical protein